MVDLFPEGGGCAQSNTGRGKGVGVGTAVVADRSMALMGDPPLRRPDLFALLLLPPSYYSLYPLPFDPPPSSPHTSVVDLPKIFHTVEIKEVQFPHAILLLLYEGGYLRL